MPDISQQELREVAMEMAEAVLLHDDKVTAAMHDYFDTIHGWVDRTKASLGLSDRALVMMLHTAPPPAHVVLMPRREVPDADA